MVAARGHADEVEDFFYSRLVLSEGARIRCRETNTLAEVSCTDWSVREGNIINHSLS